MTPLHDNEEIGYEVVRDNGLRALACKSVRLDQAVTGAAAKGLDLWHDRLEHTANSSIQTMGTERIVEGIDLNTAASQIDCIEFCKGKLTR